MSSEPRTDLLLKVATFVAIIALIVGGSLYMGALMSPESTPKGSPALRAGEIKPVATNDAPVRPDLRDLGRDAEAKPRAREDAPARAESTGSNGLGGIAAPTLPGITDLATEPVVRPKEEKDLARGLLESELSAIEACWRDRVPKPTRSGKATIKFAVADGAASGVAVSVQGIGEPGVDACLRTLVAGLDVSELSEGTSVYWPLALDKKRGVEL